MSGIPGPATQPALTSITATSIFVTFHDGANNGAAIDNREIGYSTSPGSIPNIVISDGTTVITGLTPGTGYWFWARCHNTHGWGPWSAANARTTLRFPDAPAPVLVTNPTQTTFLISVIDGASDGGSPILERELSYGRFPDAWESVVGYFGIILFEGMLPGTTYYFWARVRTAAGYSPYSSVTVARTIAGARVNDGGVWKDAVPYVNVAGVWKLAKPYVRIAGEWKETL